jgi:hypothetical protein
LRSGRIQVCPALGGRRFIDFSKRDRSDDHAVTLDEHEIGGHHKLRMAEHLSDATAGRFPKQPG